MSLGVVFADVGQGDCTLAIDAESQLSLLLDCPPSGVPVAVRRLREWRIKSIELAIATHSDWDHIGGLHTIASKIRTEGIIVNADRIMPSARSERIKLRAALRAIAGLEDIGTAVRPGYRGESGNSGRIRWRLLAPTHAQLLDAQANSDPNHASIIVLLDLGGYHFLVTGDADSRALHMLRDSKQLEGVRIDVLRLPHHGAQLPGGPESLSMDELLDFVQAEYHVVSVGENNAYGHPHGTTLDAMRRHAPRSRVLCTQINGVCKGQAQVPDDVGSRLPLASEGRGVWEPGIHPCAGSITMIASNDGLVVSPSPAEHDKVIEYLANPRCKVSITSTREHHPTQRTTIHPSNPASG